MILPTGKQIEEATPSATEPRTSPAPGAIVRRAGGLRLAPKLHLAPVFTMLVAITFLDVIAMLAVPFLMTRHTESPWQDSVRLGFIAASILAGLVFGLLTSVVADRRNHSAAWFLAGHLGTFAAPFLAASGFAEEHAVLARIGVFAGCALGSLGAFAWFNSHPRNEPPLIGRVLLALGRCFHASGNIWFGVSLLIILTTGVFAGGWWETHYGGKSARYCIYTSPWFGLLFLAFANSLINATFRKFPFKVAQAGWLTVHTALVLLIIASFMSFWGKEEGELGLLEGQRKSSFNLDTETRITVHEVTEGRDGRPMQSKIFEKIALFDIDPKEQRPTTHLEVRHGGTGTPLFTLDIDRYFANARPVDLRDDRGARRRRGVAGTIAPPRGRPTPFVVDEASQGIDVADGMLTIDYRVPPDASATAALMSGRDRAGHGTIVVRKRDGSELLRTSFEPKPPEDANSLLPSRLDLDVAIPGTELKLKGRAYFDQYQFDPDRRIPVDATPGIPFNPAVGVILSGPKGDDTRLAEAWRPGAWESERATELRYPDLLVALDYFPVPKRTILFLPEPDGGTSFVFPTSADPAPRSGRVAIGTPLDLGLPLQVNVTETFTKYRKWTSFEFKSPIPEAQVIRIAVDGATVIEDAPEHWLTLGRSSLGVTHGERSFVIRWVKSEKPLGFELYLHDFHRDFYPGSVQARTFESYLRLTEESRFKNGVDIKIDMNHPLRLNGLRLYQSRFSTEFGEATFLQVNRDPGVAVLYSACAILVLGLVIVFFQKPFLRTLGRWLEHRGSSAGLAVLASVGTIGLAFVGTLPGVLVIGLLPPGPSKGIGAVVIILGLVAETLLVHFRLKPAFERKLQRPEPSPVGVPQ